MNTKALLFGLDLIEILINKETMEHTNIDLIYNYTECRLALVNNSINQLNAKLNSILAFGVISTFLSVDLPNTDFCLWLKILVCIFLILTILLTILGLRPKPAGGMTPPNLLMEENYYDTEENCRLIIVKTWIEALKELELLRDEKARTAHQAIYMLCAAVTCAASSVVLASAL